MYELDKFVGDAKHFYEISISLRANWQLSEYVDGESDSAYLLLREEKRLMEPTVDKPEEEVRTASTRDDTRAEWNSTNLETDECELDIWSETRIDGKTTDLRSQLLTFEYHVLFSQSYSVPTLFFKVSRCNGKALRLEEFWEIVPEVFEGAVMDDSKWKFVTEQEHPFLGKPFFHVHPCHTAEAIRTLRSDSVSDFSYLLTWFSCFGPFAQLYLSNAFYLKGSKR